MESNLVPLQNIRINRYGEKKQISKKDRLLRISIIRLCLTDITPQPHTKKKNEKMLRKNLSFDNKKSDKISAAYQ